MAISSNLNEKNVDLTRTSATKGGGRNMSFRAISVAGQVVSDNESLVGFGVGKALEVPAAMKKASDAASRHMLSVKLHNKTVYHCLEASHGATKVIIMPAPRGTGIIAGSAMRAVFEVMGIENVLAKCIGSRKPVNVVRATIKALASMKTPESVAAKRGKRVGEIWKDEGSDEQR